MIQKILYGRKRELTLPNGEKRTAQFAVVDLDEIQASHNEVTFSSSAGYPVNEYGQNINDRNYKDDPAAQRQVETIAENLEPEKLVELSSKASGTPIISPDGFVVSGNNRVMSLKLAVQKFPQSYDRYKQYMARELDIFGFEEFIGRALLLGETIPLPGSSYLEPKSVKFQHPVLVRIDLDIQALNTTELAKYNADTRKGERPVDRSIKLGNILRENERCRSVILSIVDGYETFTELYDTKAGPDRQKLIRAFLDCGLINEVKLPDFFNDGEFTEHGKDFIENVLAAIILKPDALKIAGVPGVKRMRQIIISCLPVLIANDNLPAGSLKQFVSDAVVFQYRMSKVGDFSDFVLNQSLFEEQETDPRSVYLNRLLNEGRNKFKAAILKYNESVRSNAGESLFAGEKLTIDQIFERTIGAAVSVVDKRIILKAFGPLQFNKVPVMATEKHTDTDVLPEEPNPEDMYAYMRYFMDDNFFKEHPEKVLGESYQTSGRFGEVTKYKGTLEVLDRIEVPLDFVGNEKTTKDPLASTGDPFNLAAETMSPSNQAFLEEVNEKSRKQTGEILQKRERKKQNAIEDENIVVPAMPELNTFEEMYRRHNPEISREELEVFLWYKTDIGKPLSRRWVNLVEEKYFTNLSDPEPYQVTDDRKDQWVRSGLLYYFAERYLPAFLYLSGDIYAKKFQLERDQDEIKTRYGLDVYKNQQFALSTAYARKYDNRLIIGEIGNESNIVILPISKFAENFFIERLESMTEGANFKIRKIKAEKNSGQPDFKRDSETMEHKKDVFEKLSLQQAFIYYLLRSKPEVQENVTTQEIATYYVMGKRPHNDFGTATKEAKAGRLKFKASLQKEGERLFKSFLDTELTLNDKVRLETEWNAKYNNYITPNFNKVPVAFTMAKYYKGKIEELRPEKREAVAFLLDVGAGCLAYDVGVGKTPSAIFTISAFMDAGYTKRPFICVPNQVYKQFIQEIKDFAPHIPILEAYNFGEGYGENFKGPDGNIAKVPAGCITIMTYEGLEQIGFNDQTYETLFDELYSILDQGGESERPQSKKELAGFMERLATIMGKGLRGSLFNIEDFGFDFACYDEAHKLKKIFTAVKGEARTDEKGNTSRGQNPYVISSGTPSSIGLKAFMLNQYILKNNGYQNILLLTATPFTNSPLEIFSMLAMLAYEQLQSTDLNNIKNFFDTYIQTSLELVINPKLKPEFKQVILGFSNLISLQTLIRRYINYKTGEDVNVQRPNKYVLPYTHKLVEGTMISLSEEEKVETFLSLTPQQDSMMGEVIEYVEGKKPLSALGNASYNEPTDMAVDEDSGEISSEGEEIEENDLSDDEKAGVRTLRGMNFARNIALSPYLYEFSGLGIPDYYDYIETSPKLKYACECIRSVKKYHEDRQEPISGQVIYIDRGIEYFQLIRQYLIDDIGFKPHEVAIIKSGMPAGVKKGSKEFIKNLFNGELYNISTKLFEKVPDEERIKVIIGSSTIKEGINLQRYSTCLHDLWPDWNPTDFMQLAGRIWRQGNIFNSVRIVLPLLTDSMDIFIFQKLQEKTSRLNTIWAMDGKANVLKLEEFDPSELKYALIRDPKVVAELKIVDKAAAIDSEILGIQRLSDRIALIKDLVDTINRNFDDAVETARTYRKFESSDDKLRDIQHAILLIQDAIKKQTDKEGKILEYKSYRKYGTGMEYSVHERLIKPYWFDELNLAQRNLTREIRTFINPNGISFSLDKTGGLDKFKAKKEASIQGLEKQKAELKSAENISQIAAEVIEDRAAKKISYKPLSEVVADFEKLNYLLSDRKVATVTKKPLFDTCPPRENGELAISDQALAYLDKCLETQGQTKALYFDPQTGRYQPERRKLHEAIVDDLLKNVRCVKQGKPIAVFTGGSPGAGKTHFLRENAQYLLSPDIFHLDADDIRAMLPEYEGWNANRTHNESQDIVTELLEKIGEGSCRYDFIYDGTMNKARKYFALIKRAKDMGYETFIIFINVPYGVAKNRVLDRYRKTGRYVPLSVLDEFHERLPSGKNRGLDALDQLKTVVDGFVVVDGVTGEITDRGGISLPTDREYGRFLNVPETTEAIALPTPPEPAPEARSATNDKEEIEGFIKTLMISLKYLSGDEKRDAKEQINAFKLSLKFL